jgi:flavin reductase (DIM6/NTAB) family NADH-FMN oxidoreductase RutF
MLVEPEPHEFRRTAGLFTTGVTVLAAATDRTIRGMTANSLTTVSLDPLLILCCLRRDATMHRVVEAAGSFGVSILTQEQEPLARHFANPSRPADGGQFETIAWCPGPATGAPLLLGAMAAFECRVREVSPAGDHSIFLADVMSLQRSERDDPLLFFSGAYRQIGRDCDRCLGQALTEPEEELDRVLC